MLTLRLYLREEFHLRFKIFPKFQTLTSMGIKKNHGTVAIVATIVVLRHMAVVARRRTPLAMGAVGVRITSCHRRCASAPLRACRHPRHLRGTSASAASHRASTMRAACRLLRPLRRPHLA